MLMTNQVHQFPSFHQNVSYFLGRLIKKAKGAVKGVVKASASIVRRVVQTIGRQIRRPGAIKQP